MKTLDEHLIYLPDLREKDWQSAIKEAMGAERQIIEWQQRAAELLDGIKEPYATLQRIAWLNFWTRAFVGLEGARAAIDRKSDFVLRLVSRAMFESLLHQEAILEPILDDKEEVLRRLAGYTTWCLWNDRKHYDKLTDGSISDAIWDSEPLGGIVTDPQSLEVFEKLFGPAQEEIRPSNLASRQRSQQETAWLRLERVDGWLAHPEAVSWVNELIRLEKKSGNRTVSLFSLLNLEEKSIWSRLEAKGLKFGFLSYQLESSVIHGSTVESHIVVTDHSIYPKFFDIVGEGEQLASSVASTCNIILVGLALLKKYVWQ